MVVELGCESAQGGASPLIRRISWLGIETFGNRLYALGETGSNTLEVEPPASGQRCSETAFALLAAAL